MAGFNEFVTAFSQSLGSSGYTIRHHAPNGTPVQVVFSDPIFQTPLIAIPDIHLSDAGPGDIFLSGGADKPKQLAAVLRATLDLLNSHPTSTQAIQLGDWFDVWRTAGGDVRSTYFGPIQNAAVYKEILDLDAQIGLAHVIGNHDASFVRALPDRRVQQPSLFRLGFWLGQSVYAMHGHQTDIAPPVNAASDQFFVAAATTLAEFIPGVSTFEAYIDRFGTGNGIKEWLLSGFGLLRGDPPLQQRPLDPATPPVGVQGSFVQREGRDNIAHVVSEVSNLPASHGRAARLVIVGHSHVPCVAFSTASGPPVVIIDAGSWTYDQANILIAAEDTAAVFDVVKS